MQRDSRFSKISVVATHLNVEDWLNSEADMPMKMLDREHGKKRPKAKIDRLSLPLINPVEALRLGHATVRTVHLGWLRENKNTLSRRQIRGVVYWILAQIYCDQYALLDLSNAYLVKYISALPYHHIALSGGHTTLVHFPWKTSDGQYEFFSVYVPVNSLSHFHSDDERVFRYLMERRGPNKSGWNLRLSKHFTPKQLKAYDAAVEYLEQNVYVPDSQAHYEPHQLEEMEKVSKLLTSNVPQPFISLAETSSSFNDAGWSKFLRAEAEFDDARCGDMEEPKITDNGLGPLTTAIAVKTRFADHKYYLALRSSFISDDDAQLMHMKSHWAHFYDVSEKECVRYFYALFPYCPHCDIAISSYLESCDTTRSGDMVRDDDEEAVCPALQGSMDEVIEESVPWDYSNPPTPPESSSSSESHTPSPQAWWFKDCFDSVKKTVSDAVSMPSAVKSTSEKVSSFADQAKVHFAKVETDVHEALETLKTKLNALPSFDQIVDTVKNTLAKTFSFLSSFKFWAVCGCVAFLILLAITKDPKFQAVVMATASLYISIVGLTISVNTADYVITKAQMFTPNGDGLGDILDFLHKVFSTIGTAITGFAKEIFQWRTFINRIKDITAVANLALKFDELVKVIERGFAWVADCVYEKWHGIPYCLATHQNDLMIAQVLRVAANPEAYGVPVMRCLLEQCERVIKLGNGNGPYFNAITNAYNRLRAATAAYENLLSLNAKGRIPPFVLLISGPSNKGKSTALAALARDIAKYFFNDPDSVYDRNPSGKHWDGYAGQGVVSIDDFLQKVELPGMEGGCLMDLFGMKTSTRFIVPMAALPDKGVPFSSPFVVASSNITNFLNPAFVKMVNNAAAVERRFDLKYMCFDHDKYLLIRSLGKEYYTEATATQLYQANPNDPKFVKYENVLQNFIETYGKYLEAEVKVKENLATRGEVVLEKMRDNKMYPFYLQNVLAEDAYEAFLRWKYFTRDASDLSTPERELLDVFEKCFSDISCKKDYVLGTLLSQRLSAHHITKDQIDLMFQFMQNRYPVTDKKLPFLKPFYCDIDDLTLDPELVELLETNNGAPKDETCHCDCDYTKRIGVHCPEEPVKVEKRILHALCALRQHYPDLPPFPAFCPFFYCSSNKITGTALKEKMPQNFRLFVDAWYCDCKDPKNCKGHDWVIPKDISRHYYTLLAIAVMKGLTALSTPPPPSMMDRIATIRKKYDNHPVWTALQGLAGIAMLCLGMFGLYKTYEMYTLKEGNVSNPIALHKAYKVAPSVWTGDAASDLTLAETLCSEAANKPDVVGAALLQKTSGQILRVVNLTRKEEICSAFFLSTREFIFIGHGTIRFDDEDEVEFLFPHPAVTHQGVVCKWKEITRTPIPAHDGDTVYSDALLCVLPERHTIAHMKTIYKKFFTRQEIVDMKIDNRKVVVSTLRRGLQNQFVVHFHTVPGARFVPKIHRYKVDYQGQRHWILTYGTINYPFDSMPGDCDSPIQLVDASMGHGKRLLGIHVASKGLDGTALGFVLTQEQLYAARKVVLPLLKDVIIQNTNDQSREIITNGWIGTTMYTSEEGPVQLDMPTGKGGFPDVKVFWRSGYVPMHAIERTRIIPTRIQFLKDEKTGEPLLPTRKAPAVIADVETEDGIISANLNALRKFEFPNVEMNQDVLDQAARDYWYVFQRAMVNDFTPRDTLTIGEATFGIDGREFIQGVNMATSVGLPWKLQFPGKGKKALIEPRNRSIHPELFKAIEYRLAKARKGKMVQAVFSDHLKDEKRPIEKVHAFKTRMFSAAPVDFTIVVKMLFGNFLDWFMRKRVLNESAVGINPTSLEWHQLAEYLDAYPDIMAGDYKDFDGRLKRILLIYAFKFANDWYGKDHPDNLARTTVSKQMIGALHCNKGLLYYVWGANPSGNPLTAYLNTYSNCLFQRYAYYRKFPLDLDPDAFSFSSQVRMIAFGDDNVLSISPSVQHFFYPAAVAQVADEVGMCYTSDDKTELGTEFRKLSDVTFLKRRFVRDPIEKMFIGPLDLNTILEIPNWTWEGTSSGEQLMACNQAIRELALHDKHTFDHWSGVISEACMKTQLGAINTSDWRTHRNFMLRRHEFLPRDTTLFL